MSKKGMNIYKRKDGRWEGRYRNGYKPNRKIRYRSVYGKSYSAVREILEKKQTEVYIGMISNNCTVADIAQAWIADIKNRVKASTLANYKMKLTKHILSEYAGMKYDNLTAEELNIFIERKFKENLSANYISDIIVLIKAIAKFANRHYGYVNKIEYVTMPKCLSKKCNGLLSSEDQNLLRNYLIDNPSLTNVGVLLTMTTGIRIGELCALKWENIDLKKKNFTVVQTVQRVMQPDGGTMLSVTSPKSAGSNRVIPLPDFIIPLLTSHISHTDCYLLSGSKKIIEPRTMQYRFRNILKSTGLPCVSFHSLRHIFATNCIAIGFDVKTLSEILGHSSVKITLECYVHSSDERKKYCMKMLSDNFIN